MTIDGRESNVHSKLKWVAIVILCLTTSAAAEGEPLDALPAEAQDAFEKASRLLKSGNYAEGIEEAKKSLALSEAALGYTHPKTADCLNLLGYLLLRQRKLADAKPILERAISIREAAFGKLHPDVATSLNNLANVHLEQGKYAQAESLHRRALEIREAILGKHHPDVAASLINLARIYSARGEYAQAEPLVEKALAIRETALGKHHPDVARALNSLARIYLVRGLYTQAESLLIRAIAMQEATLGKNHPEISFSINNLAAVYSTQGFLAKAEPLHERAIAIQESILGKYHPDLITSLNNLAALYSTQGAYDRAQPLFERALAICSAALGKNHPEVATPINNLALTYANQGLYAKAEMLFDRALAIREAALGERHPQVAASLNTLALLYASKGQYSRARPLLVRALAIREAVLGENHPEVANSLNSLAEAYFNQGSYARTEAMHRRALAIREASFGSQHPDVAMSLQKIARVHIARGDLSAAVPLLVRAFTISEKRLRREALNLSESRLATFLQRIGEDEELTYTLLRTHPDDLRVQHLALATALLRKGRSIEETANASRAIYRSLDPKDHSAFERLRGLRTQLANASLDGPGLLSPAEYQQLLRSLADQGDALEAELARRSAPLRVFSTQPTDTEVVERVAKALPADGVLVEFVVYHYSPGRIDLDASRSKKTAQARYLAMVLFPDARIRTFDLGLMSTVDRAVFDLRNALSNRSADYKHPAQVLYDLIFKSIMPHMGDIRRVFLAPDGQLGLVPFDALHDGHGFLVDAFEFTYLTSGKDLLPPEENVSPEQSVVVISDPDFGASSGTPLAPPAGAASGGGQRAPSLELFFSTARTGPMQRFWTPLPGARREAESIHQLFPHAQLFSGPDATKQRLLHLATPGVLHIATHGFFLEDATTPSGSRSLGHVGTMGVESSTHVPSDPLLRSGLVLSGARAGPAPEAAGMDGSQAENSLVTALELAGLDFWGTQLVVLSACDTGRGDVKLGQGVYGLRRAFLIAGAETVVMSLWKVNDDSTSVLMEDYYRHLLAGRGRAEALRHAVRTLRETRPHPYYWAPFIASGKDTPLRQVHPPAPAPIAPFSLPRYAVPVIH